MTGIVYNNCHGGFGLSHEAMMLYTKLKNITVYPTLEGGNYYTYWLMPPENRPDDAYDVFSDYDIDRTDPILIQVIRELGNKANGEYAELQIAELSEGTYYRIEEYDGIESVNTIDDYHWKKA